MSWHTLIYGLHLQANCPIPGTVLRSDLATGAADICVTCGPFPGWLQEYCRGERTPYYTSPWLDEAGQPLLTVTIVAGGAYFHIGYEKGIEFVCDRQGMALWGDWCPSLTLEDAALYLLGPVMGFLVRRRGRICLHASAVAVGDRALALVGPSGSGKSTTAAALTQQGYPAVSDDVLPLVERDNGFLAVPGYPRLRLWEDSVEVLCGDRDAPTPACP
ncbi:MAG: hypothetical protein HC890_00665 [Chloroflexaceae bacterium]|nr:hypothetical protein [Chloroflexaceae bacterium]